MSRTEKLKRESKKFKINRLNKYILIKLDKLNVINKLNFAGNTKSFAISILVFFPSCDFFWSDFQMLVRERFNISDQENL